MFVVPHAHTHTHALTLIIAHTVTENTETHGRAGGLILLKKVKADVFSKKTVCERSGQSSVLSMLPEKSIKDLF